MFIDYSSFHLLNYAKMYSLMNLSTILDLYLHQNPWVGSIFTGAYMMFQNRVMVWNQMFNICVVVSETSLNSLDKISG